MYICLNIICSPNEVNQSQSTEVIWLVPIEAVDSLCSKVIQYKEVFLQHSFIYLKIGNIEIINAKFHGLPKISTKSENLSIPKDNAVQSLSERLKEGYINSGLSKRDEENDSWPPDNIGFFTTPVFVHQEELQAKKDIESTTYKRVIGNIEDIPKVTKTCRLKSIEEIFEPINNSKHPNTILIEGHPGIGKTTISKEICRRWGKGELLCSDKLLFLLLLRDPNVQKITNEKQLIAYFTNEVSLIHHFLEQKCGAGVTLIIDGFDELNTKSCCKAFFIKLAKRKILNKAKIVITSRPFASICFHQVMDRRIEILGFDKHSRQHYIDETLKHYPNKIKKLQQHLQRCPGIDAACYIPLLLNILTFLCKLGYFPPTTTEMYTNFILHMICHYLKRNNKMKNDESVTKIEEFPKCVCDVLEMLGKVAFDGLKRDKIVFEKEDLPDHELCKTDPTCFGLLQSTECYSLKVVGSPVLTFNFYHLELQEYFAARHVMNLPQEEAHDFISKHFFIKLSEWDSDDEQYSGEDFSGVDDVDDDVDDVDDDDDDDDDDGEDSQSNQSDTDNLDCDEHLDDVRSRFSYVWKFLFGLTKGNFAPLQNYLSAYSDSDDEDEDSEERRSQDYMLSPSKKLCLSSNAKTLTKPDVMGSQSSSIPPTVKNRLSQDILVDHAKILFLFQCFQEAQDSQLCKDLLKIFRDDCINLDNHVLIPYHISSLGLFLSKSNRRWKSLNLASCHLIEDDFDELHHYLCMKPMKSSTVEEFNVSDNDLTQESFSLLSNIINQMQPSCLNLSDNLIGFDGLQRVYSALTKPSTIKTLWVEMIGIKMDGSTTAILDKEVIFSMMSSLNELFIGRNGLYDEGAELLSEGLANTSSLKTLNVWNCSISTTGAKTLAIALSKNASLEILDLNSNDIGDDGAVAFANVLLNSNETLKELWIQENIFGRIGIEALQNMLPNKSSFKLHYDPIASIEGATGPPTKKLHLVIPQLDNPSLYGYGETWPFQLAEPMDTEPNEVPSPPSSKVLANINSLPSYTMMAHPRGIGVIINNKNFTNGLEKREGTDKDATALQQLFTSLGFYTNRYNDVTGSRFRAIFKSVAAIDHKNFDCVMVAILTHGTKGKLYGTDGDLIPVKDLTQLFKGSQCHSLIGKPKIFFIQACRGSEVDHGVERTVTDTPNKNHEPANKEQLEIDYGSETLPKEADFLLAYCTIPGYVSWRSNVSGSWFISTLVSVFNKMAEKEHLMDMMTEVNRILAEKCTNQNTLGTFTSQSGAAQFQLTCKQMPAPVTTLRKRLYFFPR